MTMQGQISLERQLEDNITQFDTKGNRHQRWAFCLKLSVAFLGAATTVCLGLKFAPNPTYTTWLSNIALVFSAMVTVLSVGDTFFNPRALWMEYSAAESALKAIRAELEFRKNLSGSISEDEIKDLFKRMQTILNDATQAKMEARRASQQLPPDNKAPAGK